MFLTGVALVVLFGFFPELRKLPGAKAPLAMPIVIEIVMMSVAAIMLVITRVLVDEVPKTPTLRAGVVAVIGIFGLAWLGDSFIAAHKDVIVPAIGGWANAAPWTFAFGLFFASVLLYSQAATTRALMPLGIALGIPPQFLIAMFPSVNGYFFIPTYGSLIAAINFDLSGTTRIGKYVLNHSFMIPGIVATSVAVVAVVKAQQAEAIAAQSGCGGFAQAAHWQQQEVGGVLEGVLAGTQPAMAHHARGQQGLMRSHWHAPCALRFTLCVHAAARSLPRPCSRSCCTTASADIRPSSWKP